MAISKRWALPEHEYRRWDQYCRKFGTGLVLGEIQIVDVEETISVCNMIGQEGVGFKDGVAPIRYNAIETCLTKICDMYSASMRHKLFGDTASTLLRGKEFSVHCLVLAQDLPEVNGKK